jgi:nicotinate-nucleotide pyrophosphorylase
MQRSFELDPRLVRRAVAAALAEDVGPGDVTTLTTVPAGATCEALLNSRDPGVVAGLPLAIGALISGAVLIVSLLYFRRAESTFADII